MQAPTLTSAEGAIQRFAAVCEAGEAARAKPVGDREIATAEKKPHLTQIGAPSVYHASRSESLSKLSFTLFSARKNRCPWLDVKIRSRMHAYLATVCRDAGAEVFRVGAVADHVHLITTLPRILSQADMLEGLKKKSSKWVKALAPGYRQLYWQRGYGAFSVSPSQLESVVDYVEKQEKHHAAAPFRRNIANSYVSMK
jgi:putative transposase